MFPWGMIHRHCRLSRMSTARERDMKVSLWMGRVDVGSVVPNRASPSVTTPSSPSIGMVARDSRPEARTPIGDTCSRATWVPSRLRRMTLWTRLSLTRLGWSFGRRVRLTFISLVQTLLLLLLHRRRAPQHPVPRRRPRSSVPGHRPRSRATSRSFTCRAGHQGTSVPTRTISRHPSAPAFPLMEVSLTRSGRTCAMGRPCRFDLHGS